MHSLSIQNETDRLLSHIKDGNPMTFSQRLSLTLRLSFPAILAPKLGLRGVWIAMCIELCFRGIIFLVRLFRKRWLRRYESV